MHKLFLTWLINIRDHPHRYDVHTRRGVPNKQTKADDRGCQPDLDIHKDLRVETNLWFFQHLEIKNYVLCRYNYNYWDDFLVEIIILGFISFLLIPIRSGIYIVRWGKGGQ